MLSDKFLLKAAQAPFTDTEGYRYFTTQRAEGTVISRCHISDLGTTAALGDNRQTVAIVNLYTGEVTRL